MLSKIYSATASNENIHAYLATDIGTNEKSAKDQGLLISAK